MFARDLAAIRTCRGNSRLVEFDVVGACKKTPPKIPKGGGHSLRMIALLLEKAGFVGHTGKRFAIAIARMLGQ